MEKSKFLWITGNKTWSVTLQVQYEVSEEERGWRSGGGGGGSSGGGGGGGVGGGEVQLMRTDGEKIEEKSRL